MGFKLSSFHTDTDSSPLAVSTCQPPFRCLLALLMRVSGLLFSVEHRIDIEERPIPGNAHGESTDGECNVIGRRVVIDRLLTRLYTE